MGIKPIGVMGMKKGFILLIMCCLAFYIWTEARQEEKLAVEIKDKLLRYHVVANSDSDEDQAVKLKVKEAVLNQLEDKLFGVEDVVQAKAIVEENRKLIEDTANTVLKEENMDYTATMRLGEEYFPTKIYGDLTLPPGEYDALIIELGNAEGKNWWCVLFPTLCFVDSTYGVLPNESRQKLKEVFTVEEYNAVMDQEDTKVEVKSKVVEWLMSIWD